MVKEEVPKPPIEIPEETESTLDYETILKNWPELMEIPIQDYFDKGWKPRIKKKKDGSRYITVRHVWKEEEGWHDAERSLGVYDPARWNVIMSMFPKKFPKTSTLPNATPSEGKGKGWGSKMLSTTVARHKAIPTSFLIDTDILDYYEYFVTKGYDGSLQEWMHECIRNYFLGNQFKLAILVKPIGETP